LGKNSSLKKGEKGAQVRTKTKCSIVKSMKVQGGMTRSSNGEGKYEVPGKYRMAQGGVSGAKTAKMEKNQTGKAEGEIKAHTRGAGREFFPGKKDHKMILQQHIQENLVEGGKVRP